MSDDVWAAIGRLRRIEAGESARKVHGVQSLFDAQHLTQSDWVTLGRSYLAMGKRLLDGYAIEARGVLWDGTSTMDIETAQKRRADFVARGYEDAKIVRVVTFTQEVE